MDTKITSDELVNYFILNRSEASPITSWLHLRVALNYDDEIGKSYLSEKQASDEIGIAVPTVRRHKKFLLASGLWDTKKGNNPLPTSYSPSGKLINAVKASKASGLLG